MNNRSAVSLAPPSALLGPAPAMRRWVLPLLAVVTVLLVIGGLVVEIILLKNAGRRAEAEGNGEQRIEDDDPPDTTAPPDTSEADRPSPADRKPGRPSEPVLPLVGSLMTAHLYQTYLNIGLIGDSVAREVIKVEDGNKMLDTLMRVTDTIERHMAQLPESELQEEEQKRLARVRRVLSLHRSQVKELKAYWETGEDEYVQRFQKIRKDVQKELDALFRDGE